MITDLITNKVYFSDITITNISPSLPTRWRRKPTGIDMERYYVIVTLCIGKGMDRRSLGMGGHGYILYYPCTHTSIVLWQSTRTVKTIAGN